MADSRFGREKLTHKHSPCFGPVRPRLKPDTMREIVADALPLRIFLASPGDVGGEREVVRACVAEHNARRRGETNVVFEVLGWERVRGTARRPQEAINELIAESHFLIALFKSSWGSEPGSPWGYTSGTEEELFTVCSIWAWPSGRCGMFGCLS